MYLVRADNHLCDSLVSSVCNIVMDDRVHVIHSIFIQLVAASDMGVVVRWSVSHRAVHVHSVMVRRLVLQEGSGDVLRSSNDELSLLEGYVLIRRNIVFISHRVFESVVIGVVVVVLCSDNFVRVNISVAAFADLLFDKLSISLDFDTLKRATSGISGRS